MVQDTIPLLDRLSKHPCKDIILLLDHLSDHPLEDLNLMEQMSLLERMNINPSTQNLVPLSLSTEKRDCQSQKHFQELVHSSMKIPCSPILGKRKLSTSMLMNSTPSSTVTRTNYSQSPHLKRKKTINESVHELLDHVSHGVKHGKEQGNDFSREESDDVNEVPCKRPKVKESEMGWFDPNKSSFDWDDIIYQETCRLL